VVFPRRPARRGGCHTLASLCLPRQMPLQLLKSWEAITAARAASDGGFTQLAVSVGLWPGRAFIVLCLKRHPRGLQSIAAYCRLCL